MTDDEAAGLISDEVSSLVRALDLVVGFALFLVVTPYAKHLTVVRQAALDSGVAAGEVINPYRVENGAAGLGENWPAAVVEHLVRDGASASPGPLWLDLTGAPGPNIGGERGRDDDGWAAVFRALNLGRNTFAKQLDRPLVVFLPQRLSRLLAAEAPDLWSVRSAVVRMPQELGVLEAMATIPAGLVEAQQESSPTDLQRSLDRVDRARERLEHDTAEVHVVALASALDEAARQMLATPRKEEALALASEGEALWRGLHTQRPGQFAAELAGSLGGHAIALERLGQPEQALPLKREAVDLLTALAQERPAEFQPLLALAMAGLGSALVSARQPAEALHVSLGALGILRELAKREEERYRGDLANCLINVAAASLSLERFEEATDAAREAGDIYRSMRSNKRSLAALTLFVAHFYLSVALGKIGRVDGALAAMSEAIENLRESDRNLSGVLAPLLALALLAESALETQAGQFDRAFASAGEALRLAAGERLPTTADPQPVLAAYLSTYLSAAAKAQTPVDEELVAAVQARIAAEAPAPADPA